MKKPIINKPVLKKPVVPDDHPQHSTKRQLIVGGLVLLFLITATAGVILYGKGFRPTFQQGELKLSKTGVINLMSQPTGAQVFVNDKPSPTTSTNDKLNLSPGKYKIKIAKEGYHDWQKDIQVEKEVVSNANATLFPKAPTLQSISTFGIQAAFIDPTGTKLAFNIASNSARRNGVYVFDMTARTFPVLAGQSAATQIADDTVDLFSQAKLTWSPDGKQIMAKITSTTDGTFTYYLLSADRLNEAPQDITVTYTSTIELWDEQRRDKDAAQMKSLKPAVRKFAQSNFRMLSWSPDDNKIMYQASASAEMPVFLKPRMIGNNSLYERRDLEEGAIYVYNIKEDINTRVAEPQDAVCTEKLKDCTCEEGTKCAAPFTWFPDSIHLLYVNNGQIQVLEDDGSNLTTLYAGPFVADYVYPWPDGSKIVMLTNFNNTGIAPTLYSIGLK